MIFACHCEEVVTTEAIPKKRLPRGVYPEQRINCFSALADRNDRSEGLAMTKRI
jgi:hypothetical protein